MQQEGLLVTPRDVLRDAMLRRSRLFEALEINNDGSPTAADKGSTDGADNTYGAAEPHVTTSLAPWGVAPHAATTSHRATLTGTRDDGGNTSTLAALPAAATRYPYTPASAVHTNDRGSPITRQIDRAPAGASIMTDAGDTAYLTRERRATMRFVDDGLNTPVPVFMRPSTTTTAGTDDRWQSQQPQLDSRLLRTDSNSAVQQLPSFEAFADSGHQE
jgi:hypothetical protein